jgi:hypothetical protein
MLPSPILSLLTLKSIKPNEVEKIIFFPNPENDEEINKYELMKSNYI